MEKTVSILGCGWLGLPLARQLVAEGYAVKGSTTTPHKLETLKRGGIAPFLISSDLKDHLASFFQSETLIINIPPRNKDGRTDQHLEQLNEIKRLAKAGGVAQVLFVSSTGVYPDLNRTVTEADASAECLSRGGVSLVLAEEVFTQDSDFQTTVLRMGGLYGPDREPGRWFAGKTDVAGGQNPVNMVHLNDAIGVMATILRQRVWGEVFNVSAPGTTTREEFYTKAALDLGMEPPGFSTDPAPFKRVSAEKLMERTGYRFLN